MSKNDMVMVPRDLLGRIEAALDRHVAGSAPMRVPVDPTDSDLVREEVRALLAQQHQGEPVAWSPVKPEAPGAYWIRGNGLDQEALVQVIDEDGELRCNLHQRTTETDFGYGYAVSDLSGEFEWLGPLYPHADPAEVDHLRSQLNALEELAKEEAGEVERLIAQCLEKDSRIAEMDRIGSSKIDTLRAQLTEAHALLRKVQPAVSTWCNGKKSQLRADIDAALSTSAEPSAVIDLDAQDWARIQRAAEESNWMPKEYGRNEWVSDVCAFLIGAEPSAPVEIDERAEFERRFPNFDHTLCSHEDWKDQYEDSELADMWTGWQARAALERNP